jgi:glycosyltransferase involved in cell wall biosynthesis
VDQDALTSPATKRLRIAMVCDIAPHQVGGSYISAVRFATILRARGHHVILIGSRPSGEKPVTAYEGIPYYQFFALPTPGTNRLFYQSFPRKSALRKVLVDERIEIVHVMFPSYSCGVAKKLAKELRLPIVAHVHTQPENIYDPLPRFLKTRFVYNQILRHLVHFVRDARVVICPSELGKSIYLGVDPSLNIKVISNGVDLEAFSHDLPTSPTTGHQLLYVARLMPEKGISTLVRAMPSIVAGCPDATLDVVGTGPLMNELVALARTLGVDKHITFHGRVSDEKRLLLYRTCSLFVLPSKVELEGMVVLEAMACRKPILIADAPMSASRFFVQNNGLLCAVDDADDLAKNALAILTDPTTQKAMGEQSRTNAERYDIHVSATTLERVYQSLV